MPCIRRDGTVVPEHVHNGPMVGDVPIPKGDTDRIEVEAAGPVAALDAAKRLLPDSAELVGYRVIAEAPPPGVSQAENSL